MYENSELDLELLGHIVKMVHEDEVLFSLFSLKISCSFVCFQDSSEECFVDDNEPVTTGLERRFSRLTEERKRVRTRFLLMCCLHVRFTGKIHRSYYSSGTPGPGSSKPRLT